MGSGLDNTSAVAAVSSSAPEKPSAMESSASPASDAPASGASTTFTEPHIKLWLDDVRPAPPGWLHVETAAKALAYLSSGLVTHASLDHDLGESRMDGTWLVRVMVTNNFWPTIECNVHSANPMAAKRMRDIIESEGPYG